jgi:hypothetical protein
MAEINKNFFTQRYGGVEMWVWMAIGLAGLFIYTAYRSAAGGSNTSDGRTQSSPLSYVFMVPENSLAQPDASNVTGRYPAPDRSPGTGPSRAQPVAYGFEWSPYTVLGLKETRKQPADTSPAGIARVAYGLDKNDETNATYLATLITQNNPGLDWSRPLPVGTVVYVPKLNALPRGAVPTQYN